MKKLVFAAYLLAGICAINASSSDDEDRFTTARQSYNVSWNQDDIKRVMELFENAPSLIQFIQSGKNAMFFQTMTKRISAGQAAYWGSLANDPLLNNIADRSMPSRREGVVQYVQSGMTEYTVAESHPHLPRAIEGITNNITITTLTFREYLMPSDMPAVVAAANTMSVLRELRLIDIRLFGNDDKDDVVRTIAEARQQGKLAGLTDLVLSDFLFKDEELPGIASRLAGVNVRLSTVADFNQ